MRSYVKSSPKILSEIHLLQVGLQAGVETSSGGRSGSLCLRCFVPSRTESFQILPLLCLLILILTFDYRSPLEVGVDWSITRSTIDQPFDIFTDISPNFDSIGTWCNAPPVTICFLRIKKYHFRFSGHRVRLNALCKFLKPLFRPLHRNSVLRT